MSVRCDVLLTRNGDVYINGSRIGNVSEVEFEHDRYGGRPQLRVTMTPTSIIQGEPPSDEIERLHHQVVSNPDAKVDITKAIEQAKARVEGVMKRVGGPTDEVPEAGR